MANKNGQYVNKSPDDHQTPGVPKNHIIEDDLVDANDAGLWGFFGKIFGGGKKKSSYTMRNQVSLREDAIDREATLMNVLKSVTTNQSEPDLVEASKQKKSSGTFSFFGIRSKSKENVIEATDEVNQTEVKKLPTLEDKTIDHNKKYPPMNDLTDAGKRSNTRSGLNRLKRIRDEMFKKKHQTLKEDGEPAKEDTPDAAQAAATEVTATEEADKEQTKTDEEMNFEEQKNDADSTQSSTESTSEATGSSSESDKAEDKAAAERKHSNSSAKKEVLILTS